MFPFKKKKKQVIAKDKEKAGKALSSLYRSFCRKITSLPDEFQSMREKSKDLAKTNTELGFSYLQQGHINDAVFRFKMALRFNKEYAPAFYGLGSCRYTEDNQEEAADFFRKTLAIDPDYVEAQYMLAMQGGGILPLKMPVSLINEKYSPIAEEYNKYYVGDLNYQAHELVCDAVIDALEDKETKKDILDLGCGTGLCGQLFRERKIAQSLVGVDINADMLNQARAMEFNYKPVYNSLEQQDYMEYLKQAEKKFDVILGACSLHYHKALSDIFGLCKAALSSGGLIGIAVAKSNDKDVELFFDQGCFGYTLSYIEAQAKISGLTCLTSKEAVLYDDCSGYICILKAS